MLPYMTKEDSAAVIRLQILRWRRELTWIPRQALNAVTCILIRGRQRETGRHTEEEEAV